jgi:hypothetical protein
MCMTLHSSSNSNQGKNKIISRRIQLEVLIKTFVYSISVIIKRGHLDLMVVGFTTSNGISAHHH